LAVILAKVLFSVLFDVSFFVVMLQGLLIRVSACFVDKTQRGTRTLELSFSFLEGSSVETNRRTAGPVDEFLSQERV